MNPDQITQEEAKELEIRLKDAKNSGDTRLFERIKVVQLVTTQGFSRRAASKIFNRNRSFAERWMKAYKSGGVDNLKDKPHTGRIPLLSKKDLNDLSEIVLKGPEFSGFVSGIWTAKRVREVIKKKYGVKFSVSHVKRILRSLGFTVQYPRQKLSKANAEAQEYWVNTTLPEIKKN